MTAIARDTSRIAVLPGVTALAGNVHDADDLTARLAGHDAVVSSVRFVASDPRKLIDAVKRSGASRYLVVGGAGSLLTPSGTALVDTPEFPAEYRAEALAGAAYLALLRDDATLDWTFLSPSALFEPGKRTGTFRLGVDELLVGDQGSRVSFEDFAVAMVNEIERPAHRRQRFTVGY